MQFLTQPLVPDGNNNPGRDANRLYMATALHSGKVLTVQGENAVQKDWTEAGEQQWKFVKLSNGNFKIENTGTGKVLDVEGTSDGARVLSSSWSNAVSQQWRLVELGNGQYQIQSVSSGKMVENTASHTEGLQLIQWSANSAIHQKWQLSELRGIGEMFDAKVQVYQHGDFGGSAVTLGPGAYDMDEIGLPNDSISSLRVPSGLRATLYEHANFRGRHKSFSSDASWVGDDFNDIASGILVEKVITVYMHGDYGGQSQTLGIGRYQAGDITLPDNNISSVRVPQGLMATLYENEDFTGRRRVFFEDTDWVGDDLNDTFSGIIVKATGMTLPEKAIQFGAKISLKSSYGREVLVRD